MPSTTLTLVYRRTNVETIHKDLLEHSLKAANRDTKTKGEYPKIKHASQVLNRLNVTKVRKASIYCDRLFTTLIQIMEDASDNTDTE